MKSRYLGILLIVVGIITLGYFVYNEYLETQNISDPNNSQRNGDNQNPPNQENPNGQNSGNSDNMPVPSNWETFSSEILGFSIAHPPDWYQIPVDTYSGEAAVESFDRNQQPGTGGVPSEEIKVAVRVIRENSDVEYTPPSQNEIIEEREITVAGNDATWREVEGMGTSVNVTFTQNGDRYIISAYPADSQYMNQFRTMLNSFVLIPSVDVEQPQDNDTISSPLEILGQAPGTWFFEASMSAQLQTLEGQVISQTPLTTSAEWMTEQQIPFSGTLEFEKPQNVQQAQLVIKAANPSGLPENEMSLTIPVQF